MADELVESEEVERVGMEVVMAYERQQGREPVDVSAEKVGYDIRSKTPDGRKVRYIEVKARARRGKVALTPNEWFSAQRLGSEYWLYVVVDAATQPVLYLIQDPAAHLEPEEEVQVVRYVVGEGQWQGVAEEVGDQEIRSALLDDGGSR